MKRTRLALLLALTLGPGALTACTQVLGLEEAKLDPDPSGASGSGGTSDDGSGGMGGASAGSGARPTPPHARGSSSGGVCQTAPARGASCEQCLDECRTEIDACLMDEACRLDLDSYAFCLGSDCDGDAETCAAGIPPSSLRTCAQRCVDDCSGVTLASECELHCACMLDTCDSSESFVDCVDRCDLLPPEVAGCLRIHCDAAAATDDPDRIQLHCGHTIDDPQVCFPFTEVSEEDRDGCGLAGQENGWPCEKATDCCSGSCVEETCVAE